MAKFFEALSEELTAFIRRQKVFFVATAPPGQEGRINLSPKGLDALRVLAPTRVAYLDLTGSGNETAAHLRNDPSARITLMFCAFEGKPLILRLYGRGRVIAPDDADWPEVSRHFPALPGARQVIVIDVLSGQTSCGFGVPLYEYAGHRSLLTDWAEKKGEAGLKLYRAEKNARSIDGLPAKLA